MEHVVGSKKYASVADESTYQGAILRNERRLHWEGIEDYVALVRGKSVFFMGVVICWQVIFSHSSYQLVEKVRLA